jgi:hypothetical protein
MHALVKTAVIKSLYVTTHHSPKQVSHFTNNYTAIVPNVHDPYYKALRALKQNRRISQTMRPCMVDVS